MIDKLQNKEEHRSILGVKIDDDTKSVDVWCSKEDMFAAGDRKKDIANKKSDKKCIEKKQHQVALVYNNNNKIVSVFVNWERLGEEQQFELGKDTTNKLQFYFGREKTGKNVESHVTVTNVFLYSRPFNDSEIGDLNKKIKLPKITENKKKNENTITQENKTSSSSDHQTPTPLPSGINEEEEKVPSPSRTEDGGVGGGVRVFSLLLAVLCVSAPLLHL